MLSILADCSRIPNIIFFIYMNFFTLILTFIVIPTLIWITFFPTNLHLHSHDIFFVNVFNSFIPVHFFHQIHIYICMIYALLMFSIHLFLLSCWTGLDLNLLFYLKHILFWLLNETYFVWLDPLTRPVNNLINVFLINPNVTLHHVLFLKYLLISKILLVSIGLK